MMFFRKTSLRTDAQCSQMNGKLKTVKQVLFIFFILVHVSILQIKHSFTFK